MKILGIVMTALLILSSCEDGDRIIIEKQRRQAELAFNIDALIEDKSCTGNGDCGTIGLGVRACGGGPVTYLVFSSSTVDLTVLELLVNEYNQLDADLNQLIGRASDCALREEPNVRCVSNTCRELITG